MPDSSKIRIVVKNTFLDTGVGTEARDHDGIRRRHRSWPPTRGDFDEAAERDPHLEDLNAAWSGRMPARNVGGPPGSSGLRHVDPSPASWPLAALGTQGGSSADAPSVQLGEVPEGALDPGAAPEFDSEEGGGEGRASAGSGGASEASAWARRQSSTERLLSGLPEREGSQISVGSSGHAHGACRPCSFAQTSSGCKFGVDCRFCHIIEGHQRTTRLRPSRGKRERIKRAVASLGNQVARNDAGSAAGIRVPKIILNPWARNRLAAHLTEVVDDAGRV